MAVSVTFGSYDFTDTVESWRVKRDIVVDQASIPGRHGVIINGSRSGPIDIELKGRVMGATRSACRTTFDSLLAGILNTTQNLTLDDDRFVEARVISFSEEFIEGAALLVMNWTVVFRSTLPFLQSVTLNSSTTVPTTSGNTDFTITNAGNVDAYATVTITAPGTSIANNLTGYNNTRTEQFSFLGTIAASKILVITGGAVPPTVVNDGTDAMAYYTGDFLKLSPGANSMRFVTKIGASIKIEWRDTWY